MSVCVCEQQRRRMRDRDRKGIEFRFTMCAVAQSSLVKNKAHRCCRNTEYGWTRSHWKQVFVICSLPACRHRRCHPKCPTKNRSKHNRDEKKWKKTKRNLLPFKYQFWIWSRTRCAPLHSRQSHAYTGILSVFVCVFRWVDSFVACIISN